MRKPKEDPVILTHTEILTYAIITASQRWQEEEEMNKKLEQIGSSMLQHQWKDKLKALFSLYKLETGTDYGDFDLD